MKILFTAFKGVHNASFQLVDQATANYILLTNSFQGVEKDISFVSSDYDAVYMFGIDKKLIDNVRIETCAKYNDEAVCTDFDVHSLEATLRNAGVSCTISNKPTHYLCNAAYYHMLKKKSECSFHSYSVPKGYES